eukprot:15471180-Heterocapsa_arctica.AAC.1
MAPVNQNRNMGHYVRPGLYDHQWPEAIPEPPAEEAAPAQEQGDQPNGGGGPPKDAPWGAYTGNPCSAWKSNQQGAPKAQQSEAEAAKYLGIPEGSQPIEGTIGHRDPANAFMYEPGWWPTGEQFDREGRNYLTNHSHHAKEVHQKQIAARGVVLEKLRYPDGWDGLTFRQLLEALAAIQGPLSLGQRAALLGAFALWAADNGRKGFPPSFDDSWCLCGAFVFASATFCNCGMPTGRYKKGDWMCGSCKHTNFGKGGSMWCYKCGTGIEKGFHAFGDDTCNKAMQQKFLTPRN